MEVHLLRSDTDLTFHNYDKEIRSGAMRAFKSKSFSNSAALIQELRAKDTFLERGVFLLKGCTLLLFTHLKTLL